MCEISLLDGMIIVVCDLHPLSAFSACSVFILREQRVIKLLFMTSGRVLAVEPMCWYLVAVLRTS